MFLGTQIHMHGLLMLSLSLGIPYCFMLFHPLVWLLECWRKSTGRKPQAYWWCRNGQPSTVEQAYQPSKGNSLTQTVTHASPGTGLLPSTPQEASPFSGAFIRDTLQNFGISAQATELIWHSWRPSTRIQYNSILRRWGGFCAGRQIHPSAPTLSDILDFLSDMYERGLAYNTIAAAKSVLSSIIHLPRVVSISDHPLVQRLQGFFNTRPPTSKYPYIWDTSELLDYLRTLQNDRNDFATMSKKLVTLFTLLSGQRVSTLHKFKRSMMQVLPDRIIFHLSGNLKQSSTRQPTWAHHFSPISPWWWIMPSCGLPSISPYTHCYSWEPIWWFYISLSQKT